MLSHIITNITEPKPNLWPSILAMIEAKVIWFHLYEPQYQSGGRNSFSLVFMIQICSLYRSGSLRDVEYTQREGNKLPPSKYANFFLQMFSFKKVSVLAGVAQWIEWAERQLAN